jgi:hypothetical protein
MSRYANSMTMYNIYLHVLRAVERYRLSTATNARTYSDLVQAVTTDLQRNPERVETSASDGGYVDVALRYAVPHAGTSQVNMASASASIVAKKDSNSVRQCAAAL